MEFKTIKEMCATNTQKWCGLCVNCVVKRRTLHDFVLEWDRQPHDQSAKMVAAHASTDRTTECDCLLKNMSMESLLAARCRTAKIPDYESGPTDMSRQIGGGLRMSERTARHRSAVVDSALDLIGDTPMVRLSRFARAHGIQCELLAKCEFFNAGGSVKDRIGLRMVEEAEREGRISPGDVLIEPTSGNTGIGLSLTAAVKGYKMVITLPEKMSKEKSDAMVALGAEIIRTPTEAAWNEQNSHIALAYKLKEEWGPHAHVLDQYKSKENPLAHYEWTAEEILAQCDHQLDMIVMTAGTGGTITGIGKKIKERLPNCVVVGVDPRGSILAQPEELNKEKLGQSYVVEGIGYDFIPSSLNREYVDKWVKSDDRESFQLARELIALEGLLVGGSSGSALIGVLEVAKSLKAGQRCVVLLPDSSRNYMSKFINNDWMVDGGYYNAKDVASPFRMNVYGEANVSSLVPRSSLRIASCTTCDEAIGLMNAHKDNHVIVTEDDNMIGVMEVSDILNGVTTGKVTRKSLIFPLVQKRYRRVALSMPLHTVAHMLEVRPFVVVGDDDNNAWLLEKSDLLNFVSKTW